ncbi:ROK family protein [Microbacterium sp. No. 7]|uniref:ROK family protein n=1 Tax=Microbacterium sp. No. 7 TaxID=1714373 RepID=UPI0006D16614|nr:ROK family protein [Microbacterium sp. No. 7]ALJ21822.1 hypothetical protein AOA12_18735 [Microbacterium sp. No. 7]
MTSVAIAVDLGGTKLETALVTHEGAVLPGSRERRPTGPGITPDGLRAALTDAIGGTLRALPAGTHVRGVGVGSPGPFDGAAGTIRPVNMPGLHGLDLHRAVGEAVTGLHRAVGETVAGRGAAGAAPAVAVGHDAGCLALAESWLGAARTARASLSIVVSTGIGGGYVVDGRLVEGASGNAGHIGQLRAGGMPPGEAHAADPAPTLEEVASGPASVAWARAQGWSGADGVALGRAAAVGDAVARAAIERSAVAVGAALADACVLLDVEVVAIGGGFSRVTPDYVDRVGASLRAHAALDFVRRVRVVPTALGDDGPLIGAGRLVAP